MNQFLLSCIATDPDFLFPADDCTRVVLLNAESGDYINANYVNMEIPGGQINRYIATQGPLPDTTTDFWRMVQQESSHLVVMLTTVMERGRTKCHQYWPVAGDDLDMGDGFSVRCMSEAADPHNPEWVLGIRHS